MATAFVSCDTWEQVLAMKEAGLLYVDRSSCLPRNASSSRRELCPDTIAAYLNGFRSLADLEERSGWLRSDLCYKVED